MKAEFPSGTLPDGLAVCIEAARAERPFSIFWETRTLLYLGVISLAGGFGILVYKNIDTVGHQAILAAIALLAAGCFRQVARKAAPFTWGKGGRESSGSEYLLWLGALLTGTFVGYLQARYAVFGKHNHLAVAAPALFYLGLAYRFDHRGVLQLGISGMCAAVGVAISPMAMLSGGRSWAHISVGTALAVAAVLGAIAWHAHALDLKRHFAFSYAHFGAHLGMLASLGGLFAASGWEAWLYFALAAAGTAGLWRYARSAHDAYFLLIAVVYGYIAITYVMLHFLLRGIGRSEGLVLLWFLLSCGGTIWLFLNLKTLAGKDASGTKAESDAGV